MGLFFSIFYGGENSQFLLKSAFGNTAQMIDNHALRLVSLLIVRPPMQHFAWAVLLESPSAWLTFFLPMH